MDYFRKYLSGPQGAGAPTGAETVCFVVLLFCV